MAAEIDHVFICTEPQAPAARRLRDIGLMEGSPNRHPGQGTACRRFFFENAMIELLWVEDAAEARGTAARPMKLWERWSARSKEASPFGIILRPRPGTQPSCPFDSWQYRPPLMPDLRLEIASNTALSEPMWAYFEGGRSPADAPPHRRQPLTHPARIRRLTEVRYVSPKAHDQAVTAAMAQAGLIVLDDGPAHVLEFRFDNGAQSGRVDLRPELPVILRW